MNPENPIPIELTAETQNTYSDNMPEGTASPENTPPEAHEQAIEDLVGGNIRSPQPEQPQERLTPEEVNEQQWEILDRIRRIRSGEIAGNAAEENRKLDALNNQMRRLRAQTGTRDESREMKAEEAKAQTIAWILDPEAREKYFNDIYALVDARPSEFWNEAFNPLTQGQREEDFMTVILNGSLARWDDIVGGDRYSGSVHITQRDIELALEEINRDLPEDQVRTLDDVRQELEEDFDRYIPERAVRKVLHNVNAVLYLPSVKPEQLYEQMQQFQSMYGDIAFKMPGVKEMMSLYEEALYECMAENHGFLDQEAVLGTTTSEIVPRKIKSKNASEEQTNTLRRIVKPGVIDERVKERFRKMMNAGLITVRADNGEYEVKGLESWEVDRTFTIARGMMVMTERLIEIAAESRLPTGGKGMAGFQSLFLQDIVQGVAPFRHLDAKFQIPEKGIAALLFDSEMGPFFKNWDPHELMAQYKRYADNPDEFLETVDKFYFARINPNRAGSIWSWVSWRAHEDPEIRTSLQRFLLNGRNRMRKRWADAGNSGEPQPEFLEEYQNWTGTGFRFERLRGRLSHLDSHDTHEKEEAKEAEHKAKDLFERIAVIQPHRLYLSSIKVRKRVLAGMGIDEAKMTNEQKEDIRVRLDGLAIVEGAFLRDRENLLNDGKTFDSITESDMEKYFDQISEASDRQKAKDFAKLIRADFSGNKEEYWKEYIYKREYNHGFVLWTGDVPVDEYNMSALGPTGGFARRARDNDHQAKAAGMVVGLLDNLKSVSEPAEIRKALYGIFHEIEGYDVIKARQTVSELAEGIIKFYKAGSLSKFTGGIAFKKSFARLAYGSHQAAWTSGEIQSFIHHLKTASLIDHEQEERLAKLTGGTFGHALGEGAISLAEMLALALLTMITETSLKEGLTGNEELAA